MKIWLDDLNNSNLPVLKFGSRGDYVKLAQQELNAAGFNCGIVDGIFGNKTKTAVKLYQKACGFSIFSQDGVIGSKTWPALMAVDIMELSPQLLKAALVNASSKTLSKTNHNFVNGNFFDTSTGKPVTIGWLISEGNILKSRDNHIKYNGRYDYPKGTLVVFKNGTVEVGLKTDLEMNTVKNDIWFCCQGFNLFPVDCRKEGFDINEVGRTCNAVTIGYNETTGKVIIAVRTASNAARSAATMAALGCDGSATRLDSGGSTNLVVDGVPIYTTSRTLANILYW